ncbi:MAG TPA: hypothetical protein PK239_10360 [Chitinophagales bacterium]|nr:hypothetical protein [Chitinophagales bacterium]HRK27678.1 hypothetical protein [Chitinophagales bacterium]
MADKKNFFLTENCRLYPAEPTENQLHRRWHVFYFIGKKRVQKYGNLNSFHSVAERINAAKKLAQSIENEIHAERVNAAKKTPFIANLIKVLEDRAMRLRNKSAIAYSPLSATKNFMSDYQRLTDVN